MFNPNENETEPLPSSGGTSFGPLIAAHSFLVSSKRAGGARYAGGSEFSAAFACLVEWAQTNALIRQATEFPFLEREPDGDGDEHEAWYDEKVGLWYKATYPNQFGLSWVRDGSACALEYLQRLVFQNDYFGDSIHLEAVVQVGDRIRVLTSQPHIQGEAATPEEIQNWFLSLGFQRVEMGERIAWYHLELNLLVADAHEGNVLRSETGKLFPIDLNIMRPEGEALTEIRQHIQVEPDWDEEAWLKAWGNP